MSTGGSPEDWTFPLEETYCAFGDGSESNEGAFYGFVLIPERNVEKTLDKISELKTRFGAKPRSRLHCREIFHGHQRARSSWAHLSQSECGKLISEALAIVEESHPKYICTFWPKLHFPKRFRLRAKGGHADIVHNVDGKWMVLWSFLNTAAFFDPAVIVEPVDPNIFPSPRNRPYWRFVARREERGPTVIQVHLDRENTKINWFSKKFQWTTIANEMVVETPRGASLLPIVSQEDSSHPLVDIADIFLFSVSRQFRKLTIPELVIPMNRPLVYVRGSEVEEMILGN